MLCGGAMMPVAQSLSAFIFTFLGFCFGVFFDLYRALRHLSTPGRLLTATTDLLFWFTYTTWVYIVLLRVNLGEVRAFLLFSLALGAALYFLLFSHTLMRAWNLLFQRAIYLITRLNVAVNNLMERLWRVLLWPYRIFHAYFLRPLLALVELLLRPFAYLLASLNAALGSLLRKLCAPLKTIGRSVARFLFPPPLDE